MSLDLYVDGSPTECHATADALRALRDACDLAGDTLADDLTRVAAGWTGDAADACCRRIRALLGRAERLAVTAHHLGAEIEALGSALGEVAADLRAASTTTPERAGDLAGLARQREESAQEAWRGVLSEVGPAGATLAAGGLAVGAAAPRPAVIKAPPGWVRPPRPAAGASDVLVSRLRPASGVVPTLVVTGTSGTVPPPLPAQLLGAELTVEDEDHYETDLGPADYRRVSWRDETHGEMVAEVWTWTRDGVVWRLVGSTALADFAEFTDVFEEVAEGFSPDGRRPRSGHRPSARW